MKIIRYLSIASMLIATPSLYAQTETSSHQGYGDNPNIFKVLAKKTGEAVQNTAEKVGNATERGIQKIKPSLDEKIENTKNYTTEQAVIARDNTREGINTAVKSIETAKDKVIGKTSSNIPIEQGSLSQSSTLNGQLNSSTVVNSAPVSIPTPTVSQSIPIQQQTQFQNNSTVGEEAEIKKQSLPIENSNTANTSNSNESSVSSAKNSTNDNTGVPR